MRTKNFKFCNYHQFSRFLFYEVLIRKECVTNEPHFFICFTLFYLFNAITLVFSKEEYVLHALCRCSKWANFLICDIWVLAPYFYSILVISQKKKNARERISLSYRIVKHTFLKGPEPVLDGVLASSCII